MDWRKPIEFLHALTTDKQRPHLLYVGAMDPIVDRSFCVGESPEHTFAAQEGLRRAQARPRPSQNSRQCSGVRRALRIPGGGGAVRSRNCGNYDRRCFILATLFCASAAEFFTAESWNLRYVDVVVGVAARLDIVLGIRLIDGS
jgi:hypothetical protein